MLRKQTILREADARAQLSESRRTTEANTRRQRPALDREARRLGWHRTTTKAKAQ